MKYKNFVLPFQRQKLEQCVEFETRKLQELQSTFESDWIEFRNNQKSRKLVSEFFRFFFIEIIHKKTTEQDDYEKSSPSLSLSRPD